MAGRTSESSFLIDIGEIGALRDLEFLVSGNVFNHPLPNLVPLLVDYIYNVEKPLNTLIERIII
jgi:hypothetical protein